jgi:hypothetical protein
MNLLTKNICRRSLITSVIVLFFILLLPIVSLNVESGQNDLATAAVNKDTADKADSVEKERNRDMGVSTQEADKIGNKLGEEIDNLSQRATSQFGDWMSINIYAGISWFKLFLILFLIITVVFIERKVSRLVDKTKRKIEARNAQQGFRYLMIDAASKPISMFIWIYGIYIVATPLLVLFQQPNGLNIVKTIAQKGVDFGSAVAVIWFIVRLVAIVEYRIKSWSSSADDNIDEILAPLVGKILRTFTVIIGGILIIQNLTGVKMGPLLASLGIGGIAIALAAKDSIANFFGTLTILLDKPFIHQLQYQAICYCCPQFFYKVQSKTRSTRAFAMQKANGWIQPYCLNCTDGVFCQKCINEGKQCIDLIQWRPAVAIFKRKVLTGYKVIESGKIISSCFALVTAARIDASCPLQIIQSSLEFIRSQYYRIAILAIGIITRITIQNESAISNFRGYHSTYNFESLIF